MRRWLIAVALSAAAVLALAGCAAPGGADGDLTNDWAGFGEPVSFTPEVGVCHARFHDTGYLSSYQPIDCARPHTMETLFLGTFGGADAGRTSPPPANSPSMRAVRAECQKKVNEALGGDWRSARLSMYVILPSTYAWTGGARWYRCDVLEVESLDDEEFVTDRTGSLKGALGKTSDLAYGCFNPKEDGERIASMNPVPCTAKHRSEFVGVWDAPDGTFDAFIKNDKRAHTACLGLIASYVKVPNDGDIQYRAGSIYYYPNEEEWNAGNRGVQCFLWVSDRDMTRSVKGAGSRALPIRYR